VKRTLLSVVLSLIAGFSVMPKSALAQTGTPPSYCHPCLFYGGDFDPANGNANGSINQDTIFSGQAVTYVAFYVPAGQIWTIKGLFSNVLSNIQYIIPKQIEWSISTGVSAGNAGTLMASGTAYATWTPTGRTWQGYTEYTALGRLTPATAVTLTTPGVYWMTAVPVCTKQGNAYCRIANYLLSDVEDVPAPNHKGVQPRDDAFLDDPGAAFYYVPTWGPSGACGGVGCNRFSAGLLGDAVPQ
jgi:hypothetical protein